MLHKNRLRPCNEQWRTFEGKEENDKGRGQYNLQVLADCDKAVIKNFDD